MPKILSLPECELCEFQFTAKLPCISQLTCSADRYLVEQPCIRHIRLAAEDEAARCVVSELESLSRPADVKCADTT